MAIPPTDIQILFTNYDIIAYFLNLASCSEHFISIKHRILATFKYFEIVDDYNKTNNYTNLINHQTVHYSVVLNHCLIHLMILVTYSAVEKVLLVEHISVSVPTVLALFQLFWQFSSMFSLRSSYKSNKYNSLYVCVYKWTPIQGASVM